MQKKLFISLHVYSSDSTIEWQTYFTNINDGVLTLRAELAVMQASMTI